MKNKRIRLVLEIDPARQPISGQLRGEHVHDRHFDGLLGLVGALNAALEAEAAAHESRH